MAELNWRILAKCGLVSTLLFLAGCTQHIDPTIVAQRWSETLSAFNIDPVFPPRMINVGDIFLVMEAPVGFEEDAKGRYSRRFIKLTHEDVSDLLRTTYRQYLQIPGGDQPGPNADIFRPATVTSRLPTLAFPGFNIVSITQADIGAAFPVHFLKVFLGLAGSSDLVASISIPDAEDVELPGLPAYDALEKFCNSPSMSEWVCFSNSVRFRYLESQIERPTDPPGLRPFLLFVTHVYYARSIDYSYSTSHAFAGLAAITAQAAGPAPAAANSSIVGGDSSSPVAHGVTRVDAGTATPTKGGSAPTQGATFADGTNQSAPTGVAGNQATSTSSQESEARKELDQLAAQLTALEQKLSGMQAGGSGSVGTITNEGTFLRQTFKYPVAIGYRGLLIEPEEAPNLPPGQ